MTLAEAEAFINAARKFYSARCTAIIEGRAADGDSIGVAYNDYVTQTIDARRVIDATLRALRMHELLKG